MCLRMTAAFLDSTSPLSLLWRARDLVCSINRSFSSPATMSLINSEPLSEWKPFTGNGNCARIARKTGSRCAWLMTAVAPHHLPLRDLVDGVDVIHALDSIQVPLVHCVYPQVAWLASRFRLSPLSNGHQPRAASWCSS